MDPIEKAIRNALEKGNPDDPDFRERVYRSVEAALDRAIKANPQLTVERAIARRKGLQAKIAEIESEYRPALPEDGGEGSLDQALLDILSESPDAELAGNRPRLPEWPSPDLSPQVEAPRQAPPVVSAPAREPGAGVRPAPDRGGRREPSFGGQPPHDAPAPVASPRAAAAPSDGRREPTLDFGAMPEPPERMETDFDAGRMPPPLDAPDISAPVPPSPPETVAADRAARKREQRRPFAALFFGVALLSVIAMGVLFAWQTGLFKSPEERDTSVPNPPIQLQSEDFDPAADAPPTLSDQPSAERDWITVFSPGNPASVRAPGDARAEAMQDDSGSFLRIRSGASGSAISFAVGQGVLEQLAGQTAVFSITARAEEGQDTEFSVECNFGELGDCGRKRYEAAYEPGEYLFEIEFPDKQADASGTIAITPDIALQGRAIDVYEIRAAVQ